MNHHYSDNYHGGGGYIRGAGAMQGMSYGHGGYENPSALVMARMGHPRSSYPMPQYGDSGQMHPMMQHQPHSGIYPQSGGYMGQMEGNHYPHMGNYPSYPMQGMNHSSMNNPGMAMASRNQMMGNYYNHPINPHHSGQQHNPMTNQTSSSSYSQSPDGSNPSMPHSQSQMVATPPVNSPSPSQIAHHPSSMQRNHGPVATSAPSHGMPLPVSQPANSSAGYPSQVSSPQSTMMMPSGSHTQPRSVAVSVGSGSSHPIPPHPMRQPVTQQSPQEVADNILQIASSYPTNQIVQIPLKGRHAPYHIPRSPHYSQSSSDTHQPSAAVNQFQHPSPASQPSPTPSTSSVKSPTPALAPIPNPISSPGISGLRSPGGHCLSPCGGPQPSPSHIASSYSGHGQSAVPSPQHYSPNDRTTPQHYSPNDRTTPQHYSPNDRTTPQHLSVFAQSPPSASSSRNTLLYPSSSDQPIFPQRDSHTVHANFLNIQQSSSPQPNMVTSSHSNIPGMQFNQQCAGNNPLMSLQKLVMLPETQVVDPKSVVNDACLASSQNENISTDSKNCEDPAERLAESSGLSVGCSGQSSSFENQFNSFSQAHESLAPSLSEDDITQALADDIAEAKELCDSANEISNLTATIQSEEVDGHENCTEKISSVSTENSTMNSSITGNKVAENESEKESQFFFQEKITPSLSPKSVLKTISNSDLREDDLCGHNLMEEKCLETETPDLLTEDTQKGKGNSETFHDESSKMTEQTNANVLETCDSKQCEEDCDPKQHHEDVELLKIPFIQSEKANEEKLKEENERENLGVIVEMETKQAVPNPDILTNGKNEETQIESKQVLPECKSPGVLSEVQVVVNANDISNVEEEDHEKDAKKNSRPKLRNGVKSLVRSKISKTKKASPFLRLTTPCSIAVGADEREVCERFAFRRNGYCHAFRASRLLYSGRSRQDSTGHGDSDESVENISDSSLHDLSNPQDGVKKKNIGKKSETKPPDTGQAKANNKDEIKKKSGRDAGSVSTLQRSNAHDKEVSDDDGEVCYYEGVDSSDFILNTNSSDDSFSSSQEGKQNEQASATNLDIVPEKLPSSNVLENNRKMSDGSDHVSSPLAKRTRRSPGQKEDKATNKKSSICDPKSDILVAETINGVNNLQSQKITSDSRRSTKLNSSELENGKVSKPRINKRKSVVEKLDTNGETKLPKAVVKLEKSNFMESSIHLDKEDVIDLTSSPKKEIVSESDEDELPLAAIIAKKEINLEEKVAIDIDEVKTETYQNSSPKASKSPSKKTTPAKKKKKKIDFPIQKGRDEELKESFKSMKFSRTLDMIKSQRKKDQNVVGPFIRVLGNREAPSSVSLFNQFTQNWGPSTSKDNQKLSNKQSSLATIHMVSSLPSNKTALVSSTKTISHQSWACAFCNHQSSFHSLGDLFGPYYKEEDLSTVERLVSEEAKKSKDSSASEKKGPLSKKRKFPVKKEVGPSEIWIHEACALWAPGVYLIGSKVYGMDEAMKDASESVCVGCNDKGAMIGCLHKGCAMKYHISCAIDKGCCLDEENLSLLCLKHKDKKRNSSAPISLVS